MRSRHWLPIAFAAAASGALPNAPPAAPNAKVAQVRLKTEKTHVVITRGGDVAELTLDAIGSSFAPRVIEVHQGDSLIINVSNVEHDRAVLHGFGIAAYNIDVVIDPGETKTVAFRVKEAGIYPFSCTYFCSALHQEMQGYLIVMPRARATTTSAAG